MRNTDRKWEEEYLRRTIKVIEDNLESYGRETKRMQAQIDEMLERYHDNDVELWSLLNNTITLNEHMKAALGRNERARKKPYFGRIIFQDETLGVEESLYIGKGGIAKNSTHQAVVDWRAPVANAYYENGLGKCSYTAPDGRELPIDLKLKRTFEIEGGELKEYFDTEVIANDELLTKYLSKNKKAVLGEIVATIQKEQNEIIRRSPWHNMIVQGVAGSGKTTVAMHRISYILYNYRDHFRPEDFYIVGSNRILLNYITGVLPDLDVHGVRQMTMEQLFIRLLYEEWDDKKYGVRPVSEDGGPGAVRGTKEWYSDLIAFIRRLEKKTIPTESVFLNPLQFVEKLVEGKSGVHDLTKEADEGRIPAWERAVKGSPVELLAGEAIERYVSQNPGISIQSKINMLNERLLVKVKDEFTGKGIKYTEAEKKAVLKAYRGRYGGREWKGSVYQLYRDFLKEQQERGFRVSVPAERFDVYDLAALAVLYKLVKETEVISEAHHIVIDEAQDFGMSVYRALAACINGCTYTVMGDVSQNIRFGYGLGDWEALRELLLSDPMDSFGVLKKSYRNTVEISDFATGILRHGSFPQYPVEPVIRHGKAVGVEKAEENALTKRAADICREWIKEGYDTVAVICRDAKAAKRTADSLAGYLRIAESDPDKADFQSGVMVLPVEYTKGLEFDAVLLWNPVKEDYPVDDGHARLLYVAATRALHELKVVCAGELTGLIADPAPETAGRPGAGLPQNLPESLSSGREEQADRERGQREEKAPAVSETGTEKGRVRVRAGVCRAGEKDGRPESGRPLKKEKEERKPNIPGKPAGEKAGVLPAPGFGDLPATEMLRPAGHAKISSAVRWCVRQEDGLFLKSQYGTLRICPLGRGVVRVTFARGDQLSGERPPRIVANRPDRSWKYRDNGKEVEVTAGGISLTIYKDSGAISYFGAEDTGQGGKKRLLLSERRQICRQLEPLRQERGTQGGNMHGWLFFDWQKGERLYAIDLVSHRITELRGTAKYLSGGQEGGAPPLILSDRGYGLVPAAKGVCMCCDIPAYGSYLYLEAGGQLDYYVIAGAGREAISDVYTWLCGPES